MVQAGRPPRLTREVTHVSPAGFGIRKWDGGLRVMADADSIPPSFPFVEEAVRVRAPNLPWNRAGDVPGSEAGRRSESVPDRPGGTCLPHASPVRPESSSPFSAAEDLRPTRVSGPEGEMLKRIVRGTAIAPRRRTRSKDACAPVRPRASGDGGRACAEGAVGFKVAAGPRTAAATLLDEQGTEAGAEEIAARWSHYRRAEEAAVAALLTSLLGLHSGLPVSDFRRPEDEPWPRARPCSLPM
jgi:hypothetical protein